MKVVRLSTLRTGRLYPQEIFLVHISVGGWVNPRVTVRPEAVTPSRIEPETTWLAALYLNQLRHRVLRLNAFSDQDHNTVHRLKDNNPHQGGPVRIKMGLSQLNCVGMLPYVQIDWLSILRGKHFQIWNKFVNRIDKIKFQVGRTRPLNFTFKPEFLNLYCDMDLSDSLVKPTDPFSKNVLSIISSSFRRKTCFTQPTVFWFPFFRL
jgi:hypothetical protein